MASRTFNLDNIIQDIWKKTTNGLDIYYAINNQNIKVGINTSNPTATLDVNGDIKASGDIYLTGNIYQNNSLFTGSIVLQDEGTTLTTNATTLDFTGSGVTASGTGTTKTINIPGGSGITVQDEGSSLSTAATTLNFTGNGVTASGTGTTKTINITDTTIDKDTDVSLNNLYVHGDISLNTGSIFSNGDISTNGNLNVGENINAYNNVGIKNNLDICGNLDVYGSLTTHELNVNYTNINSTNVTISDNIIAIGYTDSSNIFDKGIVFNSIKDNSNQALLWKYDQSSFVLANVGDVSGASPPLVISSINNYSDLRVGNLITEGDISNNGNLSVQGNTNVYGNTTLEGNIYSEGDVSLNSSNLFVSGDISNNGNLSVQGNTNVYGNTTLEGNIYSEGDVSLNSSNLFVSGDISSNGNLKVQGNTNVYGNTTIEGNINSQGDIYSEGQINTIDISCRSLHIENQFSNERYMTLEDDFNRDIASFTGKVISGINTDAIDLSMVGYAGTTTTTEILLSTDPDTPSYIDVSNVGINTKTPQGDLHISTSGQDFIFNDKQFFLQNDPNITTGTQERRRIVADSTGGNILFKLISNLGTGNTTNVDVFDGNMERTSANGFRPENQSYKGQRWVCRQPEIGQTDATEQAFQLRAFGSATSQTGLFEYYYDGDAEFSGTLTQGSDQRLKENIVDANTTNLVSDFQKLRFVNFNMIADKTKLKKLGVLAQDLQNIYPSAVVERKIRDDDDNEIDTRLSVKYEVLYLKSCMLVQHLLTENETLKTRLDDLESRLSALENN